MKNIPDNLRIPFIDIQMIVFPLATAVTERRFSARPQPSFGNRHHFIANRVCGSLALKFVETLQHVEKQLPGRSGAVELFCRGNKTLAVFLQLRDNIQTVPQTAADPAEFVDDDRIPPGCSTAQLLHDSAKCRTIVDVFPGNEFIRTAVEYLAAHQPDIVLANFNLHRDRRLPLKSGTTFADPRINKIFHLSFSLVDKLISFDSKTEENT